MIVEKIHLSMIFKKSASGIAKILYTKRLAKKEALRATRKRHLRDLLLRVYAN